MEISTPFPLTRFPVRGRHCGPLMAVCVLGGLFISSLAAAQDAEESAAENPFPGRFPAPSLEGGTEWLNCSGEIALRDLRGKIVLLDFWTYCCINCMHVLPDLKYLEQKYPNQLVVIGVHSAKFDNEKESENIREAILRYEIEHPVVNDSEMIIARKYAFSSWPTLILIDPEGNYVGRQPGEGNRELFDMVIGKLADFHRAKGTLDETPVRFHLERQEEAPTPLRYPGKLLADAAGNRLFISDSNHNRIAISTLQGELIDVIGNGRIGHKDGAYEEAMFDHPQGMALVDQTLYVADTENHLIRSIDLKSKRVATLAGTGSQARQRLPGGMLREIALNSPWALAHHNNVLYVAMAGPHQLWSHELGSNTIGVYAGTGREDITDGPRDACALAQPSAIAFDGKSLYVADSEGSAIRRIGISDDEMVTTLVGPHDLPRGRSLFEFGDQDGAGDDVRLQHPIGLVYHDRFLYVADTYNDRIKQIEIESRECTTWLGTGERGRALDPVQLSEPAGLSVANGKLYVADTNNHRILEVDLRSKATREFIVAGLAPPKPVPATAGEEIFTGPMAELAGVDAKAGESVTIRIAFEFTDGFKLNQLAPVGYRLTADAGQTVIDPAALNKRRRTDQQDGSAEIRLPLTGNSGSADLTLHLSYQYCRDGVGGVCRFASQQWQIPFTVSPQGSEVVTLRVSPN